MKENHLTYSHISNQIIGIDKYIILRRDINNRSINFLLENNKYSIDKIIEISNQNIILILFGFD
jgi:hypothetical protein